jgi:hypothetical protein
MFGIGIDTVVLAGLNLKIEVCLRISVSVLPAPLDTSEMKVPTLPPPFGLPIMLQTFKECATKVVL